MRGTRRRKTSSQDTCGTNQMPSRWSISGTSMDTLVADALAEKLDDIEWIDRLTAVAEGRRNASLREIDRRRMANPNFSLAQGYYGLTLSSPRCSSYFRPLVLMVFMA